MTITCKTNDDVTTLFLDDKFDFSEMEGFKSIYEKNPAQHYIIDFSKTGYMDSSGLGMLLNMKKTMVNSKIELLNCRDTIKKVLVVSRFDQHFQIH